MRVAVNFQNEQLDLEVPEGRLVGEWHGPAGVAPAEVRGLLLDALEHPREYPPLRQAVVQGDRVVIAFDAEVPEAGAVLAAVCQVLQGAGVDADSIAVLVAPAFRSTLAYELPGGVRLIVHDPNDRTQLAYLASTTEGRRIYLNRHLTDADIVIPVGRLGYDPVLGYRGPWGVIFPGLSDQETGRSLRARAGDEPPDHDRPRAVLSESAEVSWLLGCQFQVGLVAGISGMAEAVAGMEPAVRDHGARGWTAPGRSRPTPARNWSLSGSAGPVSRPGSSTWLRGWPRRRAWSAAEARWSRCRKPRGRSGLASAG